MLCVGPYGVEDLPGVSGHQGPTNNPGDAAARQGLCVSITKDARQRAARRTERHEVGNVKLPANFSAELECPGGDAAFVTPGFLRGLGLLLSGSSDCFYKLEAQ